MAFRTTQSRTAAPDSPDQLFRDLPRRRHASLFDHQGQILRSYAEKAINESDVAFQLPTGSGKTLVGLLLAEWRRRKYGERVVYLCPTRQLVNQVANEAVEKYGLMVEQFTGKKENYTPVARSAYENVDQVAVTTYSSLFNTNPYFSNPDTIILDDVHAAENYISNLWAVQVNRFDQKDSAIFGAIAGVLKGVLDTVSYERLVFESRSVQDAHWVDKIPTPKLLDISNELRSVVDENLKDRKQIFSWNMIREHLEACQVYVSASGILIRPLISPTWKHLPFSESKQRIFMSATLGSGGDLERLTGRPRITRLAIPQGWDRQGIGRRFFVFPEKSLEDADVGDLRAKLMQKADRSVIMTPSDAAAQEVVQDVRNRLGYPIYEGSDLEEGKSEFVATSPVVAVIANRYDGIDLPDDECRLLFVEGLPRAVNLQERFLMNRMCARQLYNERIQTRVLQAIGRCTRGLNDYSAVVIAGDELSAYLTDIRNRSHFHPELQAELKFGVEQSMDTNTENMLENFMLFLEHEQEWEEANSLILEKREHAVQDDFPAMDDLALAVEHEIGWQKEMWNFDYAKAHDAARECLGKMTHTDLRGYRALWHYLAGCAAYLAGRDGDKNLEKQATIQFQSAKNTVSGISWLVGLTSSSNAADRVAEPTGCNTAQQVEQLEMYLQDLGTLHNREFSKREAEIRSGLRDEDNFEIAQKMLGKHLGFDAGKEESDASPDPWWRSGSYTIVFEDHANAGSSAIISATKARQAASHVEWVREHIPGTADGIIISVLVSPALKANRGAVPSLKTVAHWSLEEFREWSNRALDTIRELRESFSEPGDLVWRLEAEDKLKEIRADAAGLHAWLSNRPANQHLEIV